MQLKKDNVIKIARTEREIRRYLADGFVPFSSTSSDITTEEITTEETTTEEITTEETTPEEQPGNSPAPATSAKSRRRSAKPGDSE